MLERAKVWVEANPTSVTLRQLYYRLVSDGLIPNDQNKYKTLSRKTAQARREGWFPSLIDRTRAIEQPAWWFDSKDSIQSALRTFRLDRTEGQPYSIYLGVEKHGMSVQLDYWFGKFGIPVLALGGYSSQTFVDVVRNDVESQGRKSVLLYAGDFDATGVDIDRDFEERTEIFDEVVRVALNKKQIDKYNLPPMPGKRSDSRSASFVLNHGELIQVELDALDPSDLQALYQKAIDRFWEYDSYEQALERETEEREQLEFLTQFAGVVPVEMCKTIIGDYLENRPDLLNVIDVAMDKTVR